VLTAVAVRDETELVIADAFLHVLMTVSPPGHEHYLEELAQIAARNGLQMPTPSRN
jgi:hypothetical protein